MLRSWVSPMEGCVQWPLLFKAICSSLFSLLSQLKPTTPLPVACGSGGGPVPTPALGTALLRTRLQPAMHTPSCYWKIYINIYTYIYIKLKAHHLWIKSHFRDVRWISADATQISDRTGGCGGNTAAAWSHWVLTSLSICPLSQDRCPIGFCCQMGRELPWQLHRTCSPVWTSPARRNQLPSNTERCFKEVGKNGSERMKIK